ncbi:MAG: hypothetical protein DRG30_01975 [Epsilonproteobacteria bacterium]|nr:MAG: hypothetical protein DRG30_01975 [Campylobacterota bacterium]
MEALLDTLTDKSQRLFVAAVVTVIILTVALVIIIFTSRIKTLKDSLLDAKEMDLEKSNKMKILQENFEVMEKDDLALREELKQFSDAKIQLKSKKDLILKMHEKMNLLKEKERLDTHKIETLTKDFQVLTFEHKEVQKRYELLLEDNSRIRNSHTKILMKTSQQERRIFEKLILLSGNKREQRREIEKLADEVSKKNYMLFDTLRHKTALARLSPLSNAISRYQKELMFDLEKHTGRKRNLQLEMITHAKLYQKIPEDVEALSWGPKEEGRLAYFGVEVIVKLLGRSGINQDKYTKFKSSEERGNKKGLDVIISLPNDQNIILDASFSMDYYEDYQHAINLSEKDEKFSEYLISLKSHIEKLKNKMQKSASSSYYWMLVPDDEALNLALKQESHIYEQSIEKHIVLVNPTMLLATLQRVVMLWDYKYHYSQIDALAIEAEEMYGRLAQLSAKISDASQQIEILQESFLLDS